jgi:hypothetical protein
VLALLCELLRGLAETIRETLPSDAAEQGVFLAGFWLALAVQIVGFTLLALFGSGLH